MSDENVEAPAPATWAILELMGHRTRAGILTEIERYGQKMARIDIPFGPGPGEFTTEIYGGSAIYSERPCTEEVGRAMAERIGDLRPERPARYQLLAPEPAVVDAEFEKSGDVDDEYEFLS